MQKKWMEENDIGIGRFTAPIKPIFTKLVCAMCMLLSATICQS